MNNISLLDCTLRDGAYITNSNFGDKTIKGLVSSLASAGIETIEIGWLKDDKRTEGSTYFNNARDIEPFIPKSKGATSYVVMMDYGRYDISQLEDYDGKSFDSIRLVFPKEKFKEAIEYSSVIKEKGYKLCLQAANTKSYSDFEILELIDLCNKIQPESLSIVDTFGVMYPFDLQRIFALIDNNLHSKITLGLHSHNNLQLSFALSMEFIKLGQVAKRKIMLDSSLCGMGRGAGNTCTELIANYLNIYYNHCYDINTIMDCIDIYMSQFIGKLKWGYSIPFCIAGQLGSHVNNIAYLQKTHNASYKAMKLSLENLPADERKLYNYDNLEIAYQKYQSNEIDDSIAIGDLTAKLQDKKVLLISPGSSIEVQEENIQKFIKETEPIVIGVNNVSPKYKYDYVFFSNGIRLKYAKSQFFDIIKTVPIIITSNLSFSENPNTSIVNYNNIMKTGWKYYENSTIALTRLLKNIGVNTIYFAGFDGFNLNKEDNYYDELLKRENKSKVLGDIDNDIKDMLQDFIMHNDKIKLQFITKSKFSNILK